VNYVHLFFLTLLFFIFCEKAPQTNTLSSVKEYEIIEIKLDGPAAGRKAEISGLAWYKNQLVLLPQFPEKFGDSFFIVPKDSILSYLNNNRTAPLQPKKISINSNGLIQKIEGYEGFEAICFAGDKVYLTVEAKNNGKMTGYLMIGNITPDLSSINIDSQNLQKIAQQTKLHNYSEETMLCFQDTVYTIYEANGANVNQSPLAHRFTENLESLSAFPFPNIEFRITDATASDLHGRFWVINYLWPNDRDKLNPAADSITIKHGAGTSHAQSETVERLVEMRLTSSGIVLTNTPPIQFKLTEDDSRNWEGLVRLNDLGFLVATDKYPETILAFVAYPKR